MAVNLQANENFKKTMRTSIEKRLPVFKGQQSTYIAAMNIILPAEQERWLQTRIANGEFRPRMPSGN
jgi:hypothetical protein